MAGSGDSNQVRIFDVEKGEWREVEPLSEECLAYHRAVEIPKEGGLWVVCLGGTVKGDGVTYSNDLLLFDIFY